jgi:poly-gamma-glutamate synthesis protein (capsule biosynthesis protein)
MGIILVDDLTTAQVRVEPNPETPLSTWIYAFVAPFPTVQDGGSIDGLRGVWARVESPSIEVFASASTAAAMEGVLGPASEKAVRIFPEEILLDEAWEARPSFGVVPFEALEPQWKVLEIDGDSPIRKTFDLDAYPLVVTFGLSGESGAVAIVRDALNWPTTNRDPNRLTVLVMTGTTALTRTTAWKMDLYGASYPGELIGHWLAEADLAHVSNEVAFTETCPPPDPYQDDLLFCSSTRHLDLLREIGVDLIELTGNHVMDWGEQAFLESLELFHQNGFVTYGGGKDLDASWVPALFEHNGNRLAFLGCNEAGPERAWATHSSPGAAPCDFDRLASGITYLRDQGYQIVITFQWAEGAIVLPAQRAAFRDVVEAGAVIVSGSQSHQPLGMEFYEDAFIHYGLGNLFFDQMQSLRLRQEFIDRHVFYNGKHISTELLTAMLEDFAQPRPMGPSERAILLSYIFGVSGW